MPNQFDGFCYPTIEEAASADISGITIPAFEGLTSAASFTIASSTHADVIYNYRSFSDGTLSSFSLQRTYLECVDVGQINNNSGVSIADALFVSWTIIGFWAIAFYFKTLKTGVRGY
jgi:hypothetical protein